jgi:murein DD-endopeptidase MepM/ murein hydrolase activator NlpD
VRVLADAGETLAAVARRVGADPAVVAALNGREESARLFPGQPVRVPQANAPQEPLRFGAVTAVSISESIEQGRTGRLVVETDRPVVLTANWNGLNLPLAPLETITRQVTLIPAPALIAAETYPLTLTYTTRAGAPVSQRFDVDIVDGGYSRQVISIPSDRTDLLAPDNVAVELEKVITAWTPFTADLVLRNAFARPIAVDYPTSSPFGTRRYYDSGPNSYDGYHAGQDFSAPPGIVVTSPAPGIVTLAEPLSVRGNAVIIDHGRGIFTGYWHLSELDVTVGQSLNTGDVIGLVGNTGLSTGAHLHWEMRVHGIAVDPMQFLSEAAFP